MPYFNLKAEMEGKDITIESIAQILKLQRDNVSYKLNRNGSFSIEEADKIQKTFFPEVPLTVLFAKDK